MLLLHRNPGSRLLDPDSAATTASKLRLISIDRPGYGSTDPVSDPTAAAPSSDIVDVVGELGLEDVALIGSGSGLFALAAAASLGQRLRSLSLVCTLHPMTRSPRCPMTSAL